MLNSVGGGWKGRLARPWAARERRKDWSRNAEPGSAQARVLSNLLLRAADTAFGRDHGFAKMAAIRDASGQAMAFREALP